MVMIPISKAEHFTSIYTKAKDETPGCFVCGGRKRMRNSISAFVESKESGEYIVAMFEEGAMLDHRMLHPQWTKVVVGACDRHVGNLEHLHELTHSAGNNITKEIIAKARNYIKYGAPIRK